jgi:hypothetical protein
MSGGHLVDGFSNGSAGSGSLSPDRPDMPGSLQGSSEGVVNDRANTSDKGEQKCVYYTFSESPFYESQVPQ